MDRHDADEEEDDNGTLALFEVPADYYAPEKEPTSVSYILNTGQALHLRLVGHSPLWGHLVWNGARTITSYLEQNITSLVRGKAVLELGAGAGLPSLVCAINGASRVIVTDYPEAELIENLRQNIHNNRSLLPATAKIDAKGYLWGAETTSLEISSPHDARQQHGFDLLIMADLLFNHSEHSKLLRSVQTTLTRSHDARALVFFTPYRPWLLEKDLAFFTLALESEDFVVEKLMEVEMEEVMFATDPGDEKLRRTVFGYSIAWSKAALSSVTRLK